MASEPFFKEKNYFSKFSSIVVDEFPKALRQTFKSMWDSKVGGLPGYQVWDDSVAVRDLLLKREGGKTDIKSIKEWDCTALFNATIFAKTFASNFVLARSKKSKKPKKTKKPLTLSDLYVKERGLAPKEFHPTVNSPTGDEDETLTLAIDQLRRLRNILCHAAVATITKRDFVMYVKLAKDAFVALKLLPTALIDYLSETVEEVNEFERRPNDPKTEKFNNDEKCDISGNISSLPASCLPAKVPHFTGRKEEREKIMASLTSESKRLVSICGSPGFGKTSTAIAIGHDLQSQKQSVYFFTFRGISTKDEFISKLLSFFKRSTKSTLNANLTPADELCRIFEEIHSPFFVILDNLDDLLECSKSNNDESKSLKDDIFHFIEEILGRCQSVRFLTTTRESLHFLDFKSDGNESITIGPLDPQSSENLVFKFLPCADKAITSQIAQICGNVALAIKLMCSLIKEDNLTPTEYLDGICKGAEGIANPSYPTDLRIQVILQSFLNELYREEREAFISLSSFGGVDFHLKVAVAVIGGNESKDSSARAKRALKHLVEISLIDSQIDSKTYSLHPLLQSFAIKMGENELKGVSISSKIRLYDFYINLFAELNEQFLTSKSMAAFDKFYQEENNIWLSFHEGFQNEELCNKLFDVLTKAKLFLDALYPYSNWNKVESLYDLASKKAQEQGNDEAYASLTVSKCFTTLTAENNDEATDIEKAIEIEKKLVNQEESKEMDRQNQKKKIARVYNRTGLRYYFCKQYPLSLLCYQEELRIVKELHNEPPLHTANCYNDIGHVQYNMKDYTAALQSFQCALDITLILYGEQHPDTAYFCNYIGHVQYNMEDYTSALQSYQRALDIGLKLYGEQHADTAQSYNNIGLVQRNMEDYTSALQSYQRALDITLKLYGEQHADTAQSYANIGVVQYHMKDYISALQSYQRALDIRLELYGEQHADTAQSYYNIAHVQSNMKDYTLAQGLF